MALTATAGAHVTKISLVRALEDADAFTAVVGATPGETVALIEYLLALLHAADHVPRTDSEWCDWVRRGESLAPAAAWLRNDADERWNLFDPEHPLGQNIALAPFMAEHGVGPAQLVIEQAGDYNQFFDHRHLHHGVPVPADVAFRALLTRMAYGPGGNAKVKKEWLGPLLFPQSTARLAGRVRVLALGRTLGETLRLNLIPGAKRPDDGLNYSWTGGRPRRGFRGTKVTRLPDGPADTYSYLCRSVLLHPVRMGDGSLAVDRVLIGSGEVLPELPGEFLQDAVMVKGKGKDDWVPLRPSPDRAMWREAHALYATVAERTKDRDLYNRLALLPGTRVQLWTVGLITRQQSTPVAWVADEFPYVPGQEMEFREVSEEASGICEYVSRALWAAADTARVIVYPNPKPTDKKQQTIRFNGAAEMWAGAGEPFHALLDAVAEGLEPAEGLIGFAADITDLAITALNNRLDSLPSHGSGVRARLEAQARLRRSLTGSRAPYHLQEAAHARR
ncbi:type I-E CRISPR-associated protein Cse1/CasA [Streptomyces cucumeris]|uniref:type I-E CRISPR-associated protein Cse1/CasA n=1 Tax=Streptomyces cucumeris TaxID=2962890 RepID=UPI003D734287